MRQHRHQYFQRATRADVTGFDVPEQHGDGSALPMLVQSGNLSLEVWSSVNAGFVAKDANWDIRGISARMPDEEKAQLSEMTDQEKAQVSVHLAEYARLVGEMHATFQRQQQQVNIMVVLAAGIVTVLFPAFTDNRPLFIEHRELFVLIPVPFLILSALHLRDDIKISAIDEYIFLILRERIMFLTGAKDTEVWRWLFVADRITFGVCRFWKPFYISLSFIRYAFPFIIIVLSLYMYLRNDAGIVFCWAFWPFFFWANILGVLVVFSLADI